MSKWKQDHRIRRALSNGPRYFALVVLPLIKKFGDEAKKTIWQAMYEHGLSIGKRVAKKTENHDDLLEFERLLIEDMIEHGANTPGFDDPSRKWIIKTKKKVSYDHSLCEGCGTGIPDVWKEMGYDDKTIRLLGELWCEPHDLGLRKGFNPKMEFKLTKIVTRGDSTCEWYEELKE
jgi:hypothetical protein